MRWNIVFHPSPYGCGRGYPVLPLTGSYSTNLALYTPCRLDGIRRFADIFSQVSSRLREELLSLLIIPFASALAVPILAAVAPRPKTLYRKKSRFDIFFAILVPEKTAISSNSLKIHLLI